ncbi:MAG: DUF5309 family protein [Rhodospirillaceae bacterium]|nr:DUF5309 family protein [Rhodospirillaceae bacterium]
MRLGNRCSISKKVYAVSGTSNAVDVAGVDNELDEQRLLKGIELKRDMEINLLSNTAYDATSSTASARKNAGLPAYITNADVSGIGGYTIGSGTGATAWNLAGATIRALTLTILNAAMKAAYVDGGKPKLLMLSPDQKVIFSGLAFSSTAGGVQIRYNMNQVRPAALIGAVETWQSDFGAVDVVVNVQFASDTSFLNQTAFLIDPRYVDVPFLRPFMVEPLAKTGDADPEHVLAEYTLRVGAPNAHAFIPKLAS